MLAASTLSKLLIPRNAAKNDESLSFEKVEIAWVFLCSFQNNPRENDQGTSIYLAKGKIKVLEYAFAICKSSLRRV
jgi:hypothetical protein